jgi:hypothetical protein
MGVRGKGRREPFSQGSRLAKRTFSAYLEEDFIAIISSVIESKFTLFEVKVEVSFGHALKLTQASFCE